MKKNLIPTILSILLLTSANSQATPVSTSERIPALQDEYVPVSFYSGSDNYIIVTNGKRDEYRAFKWDTRKMEITETDVKTASSNHPFATNINYTISLAPRFKDQPFGIVNGWKVKYHYDDCTPLTNYCSKLILTLTHNTEKTSPDVHTILGNFDSRKKLADPQLVAPTLIFKSYQGDIVDGVLAINMEKNEVIKRFSNDEKGVFSGTYVSLIHWNSRDLLDEKLKNISADLISVGNNTGLYLFTNQMVEIRSCIFVKDQNKKIKTMKCDDAKYVDFNKKERARLLQSPDSLDSSSANIKSKTKIECLNSLGIKIVNEYYEDANPKKDNDPKYENVLKCHQYK